MILTRTKNLPVTQAVHLFLLISALTLVFLTLFYLTGCSLTRLGFRGSPVVAALNENDIEAVAIENVGFVGRGMRLRPAIGETHGDLLIVTNRAFIRRLMDCSIYAPDTPTRGDEVSTGFETVVVTFLPKAGVTAPSGKLWATRKNVSNSWKEWDNRVAINFHRCPAFASLLDEITEA